MYSTLNQARRPFSSPRSVHRNALAAVYDTPEHPLSFVRSLHSAYTTQTFPELVPSDAQRRTIYALSTPPGKAGVAVIRVSGPDSLEVWRSMLKIRGANVGSAGHRPVPWRMYRCDVLHPHTHELLDSGLAVYFKGPKSFTAEDVVELHIHSGRAIIASVLEALAFHPMCRLAEPGEFTRRAYLAGRLDLTEVEGLHDLINAETASQRKAALQAVGGTLKERFEALRGDVLRALSLVEAVIDFGEEEVEEDVLDEAFLLASRAKDRIQKHLMDYRQGEILRTGVKLAIFGPPNAGKSSLLNFLAQREAAIVTNIPGTTRDVLELSLDIGGLPVVVADTAGLRKAQDEVERIGVRRAGQVIANSDIALCVLSIPELLESGQDKGPTKPLLIPDDIRSNIAPEKTVVLLNKTDLAPANVLRSLQSNVTKMLNVPRVWVVSLTTSSGVDRFVREFGDVLKERFDILPSASAPDSPLVINPRHRAHLQSASKFLDAFLSARVIDGTEGIGLAAAVEGEHMASGRTVGVQGDLVCIAEELRYAAQAIGKITGRIDVEDMAIDGVIILDATGRAIIQSGFRSRSSAYPLLHIDALNNALEKAARPGDVDPVLYVSSLELDTPSACCHVKHGELRFLCPVSGDMDPLYVFAFLRTFIDILGEYFGPISAETLKDNFDIVYQLLEETLDAGGHPATTYPNALRDIVLPPSLLQKMLTVAGVSALANPSSNTHPFASPIPWRKTGVRYNNNEIFFDISEELRAVVNKYVLSPTGRQEITGLLPRLTLTVFSFSRLPLKERKRYSEPRLGEDTCKLQALRLQRWSRDKQLSFVPPDGRFTLMEYRYAPGSLHQTAVPFALKAGVKIDESRGTFDLTISSRLTTRIIEHLSVEWYLGDGATGASCMASNNASWTFDQKTFTLRWEMKTVAPSSSYNLRGNFASRVKFEILQYSFSSLKVDQLRLTGEIYKPYKGVRGRATGDVEWRSGDEMEIHSRHYSTRYAPAGCSTATYAWLVCSCFLPDPGHNFIARVFKTSVLNAAAYLNLDLSTISSTTVLNTMPEKRNSSPPPNADTRPLPSGWIARWLPSSSDITSAQRWIYVNQNIFPEISSWVHPSGPPEASASPPDPPVKKEEDA
ncbi:hypothetical protein NM688_g2919 [Phlebia brevispora]|uniref:Uncharacterized protein n=1 Tax=Phlebia brevispora TaxID=194682 RepID=A0ACC1T7E9_9APHY|nr:hypothetical protein NM688_g2919 [Phlebia brevispora]